MNDSPPLLFALFHTAHALQERLDATFSALGLSAARYGVLDELARSDAPLALGDIAARQSCVRSNMTQLVDRLEAEGLVRRVADPTDRRSVRAEITPEGRERRAAGEQALAAAFQAFDDALSNNDRAALTRILAALDATTEKDS